MTRNELRINRMSNEDRRATKDMRETYEVRKDIVRRAGTEIAMDGLHLLCRHTLRRESLGDTDAVSTLMVCKPREAEVRSFETCRRLAEPVEPAPLGTCEMLRMREDEGDVRRARDSREMPGVERRRGQGPWMQDGMRASKWGAGRLIEGGRRAVDSCGAWKDKEPQ